MRITLLIIRVNEVHSFKVNRVITGQKKKAMSSFGYYFSKSLVTEKAICFQAGV